MKCQLSLIVPVYNVEAYLEELIHSIEEQTFRDYEVILVNDGSTDRSPQICEAYAERDDRVRVIHSPNKGVSHARNLGLDAAGGEYVQFIDADDLLADRDALRDMMRFTTDPKVDLVVAGCVHFRDGAAVRIRNTGEVRYEMTTSGRRVREFTAGTMLMIIIFSKRLLTDVRFDTRIRLGEDVLFVARALSGVKKAVLLDRVCYKRRLRSGSAVHSAYGEGDLEQAMLVSRLLYQELHGKPGGDRLYEKYYVDHTGLFNRLVGDHRHYSREKRIIRERILKKFPHFLFNGLISINTKLMLCAYIVNPDVFFMLFKQYKKAKHMIFKVL